MASLPAEMQRNYVLLRELDLRFHDLQKRMERQCASAFEDVSQAARVDSTLSDARIRKHSKRIAAVQQECLSIAEEKIALALQTYELVDGRIQQLDSDYRQYEEERRREKGQKGVAQDNILDEADGCTGDEEDDSFVDPNEPTYCCCKQVSYGEMIACDNPECKIEWFHFDCVGIKDRPKGKWFCAECATFKRRRGK